MIGIFDSGVGGFNAFYEVRRALPLADIAYLADRGNAPYGTKEKDEIITLVKRDIERLREYGAEIILIACCTASAVYEYLTADERRISIPIISPAAIVAARGSRIAVIATERTVREKAFSKEIIKVNPLAQITETATQELVSLVEGGARGGRLTTHASEYLDLLCDKLSRLSPDTLVLGCTHFSHLTSEFESRLCGVNIVSPAAVGAKALVDEYKKRKLNRSDEYGRTIYL